MKSNLYTKFHTCKVTSFYEQEKCIYNFEITCLHSLMQHLFIGDRQGSDTAAKKAAEQVLATLFYSTFLIPQRVNKKKTLPSHRPGASANCANPATGRQNNSIVHLGKEVTTTARENSHTCGTKKKKKKQLIHAFCLDSCHNVDSLSLCQKLYL